MATKPYKHFAVRYRYEGKTFSFQIQAASWTDAEKRVRGLATANVVGEVKDSDTANRADSEARHGVKQFCIDKMDEIRGSADTEPTDTQAGMLEAYSKVIHHVGRTRLLAKKRKGGRGPSWQAKPKGKPKRAPKGQGRG